YVQSGTSQSQVRDMDRASALENTCYWSHSGPSRESSYPTPPSSLALSVATFSHTKQLTQSPSRCGLLWCLAGTALSASMGCADDSDPWLTLASSPNLCGRTRLPTETLTASRSKVWGVS